MFSKESIMEVLAPVFRVYNIRTAVLFGSYAKGNADECSDVDLFVDSGLSGMKFVGFVENIREALGDKDVDVLDKKYVESGSQVSDEINQTGVKIYER